MLKNFSKYASLKKKYLRVNHESFMTEVRNLEMIIKSKAIYP